VSRSFELLQLASVRTFQQHVQTTLSVQLASGFLSKTQLWEVRCNHPDDVDSSPLGPEARASNMEITCIRSIVRMTIPLVWTSEALVWKLLAVEVRPSGRGSNQERISAKFSESLSYSCPSERPMTTVWMAPRFIQAKRSFEPSAYK
jgi:hypothetical protein